MRTIYLLAAATLLLTFTVSCAVTSGTTFRGVVEAEASSDDSQAGSSSTGSDPGGTTSPAPDPESALTVRTTPDGASVWIDGDYLGTSPVSVDELPGGTYRLRVEKDGYYAVRRWIDVPDTGSVLVELDLEQITGFISVTVNPPDADVVVGGLSARDGFAELPVGRHTVIVRRFGYMEHTESVRIRENAVTRLDVTLLTAPFELSNVSVSRRSFNPSNPGNTGRIRVNFRVSGPGTGTLEVTSPSGSLIESVPLPYFTTWQQSIQWPGSASPARRGVLPAGEYNLRLQLSGDDGRKATHTSQVTIDPGQVVRYRSVWHSAAGLLYAHAPAPLPPGNVQTALLVAGIATELDGESVLRFPGKLSARIGVARGMELTATVGLIAHSQPLLDRWTASGSFTWNTPVWAMSNAAVTAGITAGGAYRTPDTEGMYAGPDTLTDSPGFFLAIPLQMRWNALSLSVAPEFRYTIAPVSFGTSTPPNGWTPYLYGRVGALVDVRDVTAGVSTALRSAPLDTGFSLELPLQAGAELHWFVPDGSVVISGIIAGEWEDDRNFYVMGGVGLAVLF